MATEGYETESDAVATAMFRVALSQGDLPRESLELKGYATAWAVREDLRGDHLAPFLRLQEG